VDIASWLRNLGLERYEAVFHENGVSAEVLCHLTTEDLKELGVSGVGHRRQLMVAIAALRPEGTPASDPVGLSQHHPPINPTANLGSSETTAERRPLSVMFCDLIGSTALSSRLDAEDLREVIRTYQACVATTIRQFDGFIARYVGDGVLIYFGWPEARETDAERAVRAGLAVAAAVSATSLGGEPLHVRVGIATGLVVIGEPIGSGDSRQQTAVGETPNLAARLQGLAGPDQVVIDAATRRQIGGLFECQDLGTVELKGVPVAVPVWQVLGEGMLESRFEALRPGATPLVGREEEMDLLLRRWAQAKAGNGRAVLISAEPGVGKSRLAEALAERIAAEPHTRLRYFCSPHHQDSALYPVIARMERAAGFRHEDGPAARLAKLQALLAATAPPVEDMALIAELHSLPSVDLAPPLDVTSQRKKDKMFEALLRRVEGLARQQPVLMVFDDLHWIDPSSRELLHRVIERIWDWPVLLLAMFRPEFQPPWTGQPHVTMLTLPRLDRRDTAAMVANVAGNAALPPDIMEEIAERTDGVPLFVEELTKAVLEARVQAPAALLSAVPHPALSVPATLHASLMARLDRLGSATREVAQAGAAIGRDFGYGLLTAITDLPEPQLREALDRLINAGLVFARGAPPEASYLFKHALVQDAAYGSLLRSRRQSLHRRIAVTIEERFPEMAQAQPALIAQHCAAAGLVEQAVEYWLKASQQALMRFAVAEAAGQARKGLEALSGLPDGPWRRQQELELQLVLSQGLMITKGSSATETVETLARAQTLADQLDRPEHVPLLAFGRWTVHQTRAEYRLALAVGQQVEGIGEVRNDADTLGLGRLLQGWSRLQLGELVAARDLLEEHADPTHIPVDPRLAYLHAVRLAIAGRALLLLGYIDQARSRMGEALSLARRIRNAPALTLALISANMLDLVTGSPLIHAEELLAVTIEQKLAPYLGWGTAFRGLALAADGQTQEAFALLTQALTQRRAGGALPGQPSLLAWLAKVAAMLGRPAEAWCYLAEAARIVEATDERVDEAEVLYWLPGDLLSAAGDQSGAERHYRQAIAVAEQQSAKLFQLRASTSLAQLLRDQSRRAKAHDLLAPIYGWFTEGFDAPVLKDARALLDELA
jgi:class 3 adenylate cyclase/tetratricopeptide (TPR) repeat protein